MSGDHRKLSRNKIFGRIRGFTISSFLFRGTNKMGRFWDRTSQYNHCQKELFVLNEGVTFMSRTIDDTEVDTLQTESSTKVLKVGEEEVLWGLVNIIDNKWMVRGVLNLYAVHSRLCLLTTHYKYLCVLIASMLIHCW